MRLLDRLEEKLDLICEFFDCLFGCLIQATWKERVQMLAYLVFMVFVIIGAFVITIIEIAWDRAKPWLHDWEVDNS